MPLAYIGGVQNKVIGSDAAYEIKEHIAFAEAADFNERSLTFLEADNSAK
ncbi:MAG: hypothetical protein J1G30_09230 [Spirochaetales bacterium]|nr:hypothetical protein [Spirochaetales bacterium]